MAESMSSVQKLRSLLADESSILVGPGVYDGFTARIALAAGFNCLYMVYSPTQECQSYVYTYACF